MNDDRIADLPLTIESVATERLERETSSEFTRVTTVFSLSGPDPGDGGTTTGRGEDVTYETEDHDRLAETGLPDLTGDYTVGSFSERLADLDLFPGGEPDRDVFRNYRRWGLESAALDLALRRAETDLGSVLDRSADPVRFVASTRLGEPPTTDRLEALRERVPDLEFKLDPTPAWDADLVAAIDETVGTDSARILDLKGQYEGTDVDVPADPELYELVLEAFPDAVIEDPNLTDETRPLFEDPAVRSRVSWDAPIHGLADIEALPWEPSWLNIKPLPIRLARVAARDDRPLRGTRYPAVRRRPVRTRRRPRSDSDGGVALLSRRPQRCRTAGVQRSRGRERVAPEPARATGRSTRIRVS